MAGISSKAAGKVENKDKTFQGQKFDAELGLNYYQFKWRNHDPQTGRFIEVDPLANDYVYNSTYAFSENKVIGHIELEGLEAVAIPLTGGIGGGALTAGAAEVFPPLVVAYGLYTYAGWAAENGVGREGDAYSQQFAYLQKMEAKADAAKIQSVNRGAAITIDFIKRVQVFLNGQANQGNGEKSPPANETQNSTSKNQSALPKPPKGKGGVPPNQRDPKRLFTKKEKSEM